MPEDKRSQYNHDTKNNVSAAQAVCAIIDDANHHCPDRCAHLEYFPCLRHAHRRLQPLLRWRVGIRINQSVEPEQDAALRFLDRHLIDRSVVAEIVLVHEYHSNDHATLRASIQSSLVRLRRQHPRVLHRQLIESGALNRVCVVADHGHLGECAEFWHVPIVSVFDGEEIPGSCRGRGSGVRIVRL